MKPVRLPAAATIALPRWGIVALCLLYILPGLIGRDPWKGDDATSFGIMWTMAHGTMADWLWPHIVGLPMAEKGPLAFWIGALCIKIFGGILGEPMAARLSTGVFFLLGSVSVWYATYLLGRRAEAQPLKLAFGGQPEARDFGRTLADGALLIYLGCLGLLIRSHETSAETLQISLTAFILYLSVRLFDTPRMRLALQLGVSLGLLVLTKGWVAPASIALTLILLSLYRQQTSLLKLIGLSLPVALILPACWIVAIHLVHPYDSSPIPAWMEWNYRQLAFPGMESVSYFFKYGIWFAWPAWPFAGWAIYAWRRQEKALHISLPAAFFLCFVLLALMNPFSEESLLLPILPPLAILAAFGLPTMKRSAINAVDWFAVTVLTATAGFIWLGWIAEQTGWPVKLGAKILHLAPGFSASFNPFIFVLALAATIAWFLLVYWRISRQPSVLWRAVVLSSGGVILCWLLLLTLWLPWINHRITYAPVAEELAQQLPNKSYCIEAYIGPSQRSSFAYFGKIQFATFSDHECGYMLLQSSRRHILKTELPAPYQPEQWDQVWSGHRAADKDEIFTLYRRKM
ncbi:ArnT family glycosyltransferase [Undibacterium oligocarboniphilum]|uniref:Glycosyltransferase family 39 protein n=1 Tax=Undibacterium oligocarboniphilum TaxID=666702 RepID=A0A850QLW7_9BURK|nr:glycosyltransferase family 39 protein [Undibacterium oligocarboniphilum]MBC3869146.1 glycosyltransferase family 39 protein [Undibacterium oligocarboniphilum]NVO77126.1 glycosyltransferase family 39 protein [Undibacterium oligocarboniphilum]